MSVGWQRLASSGGPSSIHNTSWRSLKETSMGGYYDTFRPRAPSLSSVGHLRIRIGGMAEPPSERCVEAYIVVSINGQSAPPTRPLPREDSALLPQDAWQAFTLPLDVSSAVATTVQFEMVCWAPGVGESSVGAQSIDVERVVHGGRLELLAPYGLVVEVQWLPPANALRSEADVLVGSGVRFAVDTSDERAYENARASVWAKGHAPSPSRTASVCGLPPSTPPRAGHRWEWGYNSWHEVKSNFS